MRVGFGSHNLPQYRCNFRVYIYVYIKTTSYCPVSSYDGTKKRLAPWVSAHEDWRLNMHGPACKVACFAAFLNRPAVRVGARDESGVIKDNYTEEIQRKEMTAKRVKVTYIGLVEFQ